MSPRGSRRTNLALAVVVPCALLTGALAFAIGSVWAGWVAAGHAITGLAIVALSPWKTAISQRGLRRRHIGRSWPSIVLGALVVVIIATGLAHSTGLARTVAPATAMQIHVASALASIPLFAWHLIRRPVRPRRTDLSRREVLRAGVLGGASIAAYGAVSVVTDTLSLPGAGRGATGSYEVASFAPAEMPVTQWLDDAAPHVGGSWRLEVHGADGDRAWALDDLVRFDDTIRAVLDCTGGWYSMQEWQGVLLSRLMGRDDDARSIVVRSATGYGRRFPVADAGRLLLAFRVGGARLSVGHGAPARLVAPGRRGFWWVKWVTSIRADAVPWWWQPPFPLT
jgi:Oxidoreductase molybdopterin binding domain